MSELQMKAILKQLKTGKAAGWERTLFLRQCYRQPSQKLHHHRFIVLLGEGEHQLAVNVHNNNGVII